MANSFDNDFTITNIGDLKNQYKKGAAFYHLKAAEFNAGQFLIIADDAGNTNSADNNEHLSFGNGTTDDEMSIVCWLRVHGDQRGYITSKIGSRAEWALYMDSDWKLHMELYDENNTTLTKIQNSSSSGLQTEVENRWAHIVVTYNGAGTHRAGGGGEAPDYGVTKMYVNGSQISVGDVHTGSSYTAMDAYTDAIAMIGSRHGTGTDSTDLRGAASSQITASIADLCFFKDELRASEVSELYNLYFNTHYKDLTHINLNYQGTKQIGGMGPAGDPNHETALFYKSPVYSFSAAQSSSAGGTGTMCAAYLFGNGIGTQAVDFSGNNMHDVRLFGGEEKLIFTCHNSALSRSSADIDAHVMMSATRNGAGFARLISTSGKNMNESSAGYPANRAADLNVDPSLGLNIPGPGRLRGRNTPYKVTKK